MLLNVILLSISSSIDSFGIGITYGLRKLKIACMSKFILFVISITITYIAILIGKNLSLFLSPVITKFFGAFIVLLMSFPSLYAGTTTPIVLSKIIYLQINFDYTKFLIPSTFNANENLCFQIEKFIVIYNSINGSKFPIGTFGIKISSISGIFSK